jgi:hypothetical protein
VLAKAIPAVGIVSLAPRLLTRSIYVGGSWTVGDGAHSECVILITPLANEEPRTTNEEPDLRFSFFVLGSYWTLLRVTSNTSVALGGILALGLTFP